jgi:hypothetical protein
MDTFFIEIAGQACFTEQARHFPVSVQLEVMLPIADADDIHERFKAWDTRFTEAIEPLRSLFASIEDGGSKFDIKLDTQAQVVTQRKRLTRRYRFIATSSEARDRLVELVSGFPSGKQETVDVMIGQPIFDAATEAKQQANYDAIEDAHAKAAVIARASGGRVGRVLSARQMPEDRNVSGALGDESLWGGFHVGGGGRTLDADEPTRKVFVRFLVRFELIHNDNIQRQAG